MQRVTVVVGVAERVVVHVEPPQEGIDVQEQAVEPLGLEHRTVHQLVAGEDEEAGHSAMEQQRKHERHPEAPSEQVVRQHAGGGCQRQVPHRLERAAPVVALHQAAQLRGIDRTAVPPHPHAAADLVEGRVGAGHGRTLRLPQSPPSPDPCQGIAARGAATRHHRHTSMVHAMGGGATPCRRAHSSSSSPVPPSNWRRMPSTWSRTRAAGRTSLIWSWHPPIHR